MPVLLTKAPLEVATSPKTEAGATWPLANALLCGAVALIVVLVLIRAWVSWGNDAHVGAGDGVTIAQADDLTHGVFYRPLFGPDGYGATRYFPLYFVLDAILLKAGLRPLASAYALSGAAVLLLLAGTYSLLRGLGSERWLAACSAGAVLAGLCVQGSLLSPHADGLACALNVCGLALVVRARGRWPAMLPAALLFTLAWSTKITTVGGVAAGCVWLVSTGFASSAVVLATQTALGYLLVIGAMIAASRGRVLDIFVRANASRINWWQVMLAPRHMFQMARRTDPPLLVFVAFALLVLVLLARAHRLSWKLPIVFFVFTLATTALIFGYRGTVINHCVDAQVASVILIGAWLANDANARQRQLGIAALGLAVLAAAIPTIRFLRGEDLKAAPHRFENAIAFIGETRQPILAENPAIPVLAGQRAYVLDPYMLAMVRQIRPDYGDPLLGRIRRRGFSAIVLCILGDPRTREGHWWYDTAGSFGPGFGPALVDNYYLATAIGDQKIWLPKP